MSQFGPSELIREIHEIVFVLETVVMNSLKLPTKLVQAAFDGDPTQSYEPDQDRGRNYMLNMRAAIYFVRLKYDVSLDEYCDVIAEDKKNRYFIECKRLYSESKVETRISEAYKQLDARLERKSDRKKQWGIAWVDPSAIILQHCRFYMAATREGAPGGPVRSDPVLQALHRSKKAPGGQAHHVTRASDGVA